MRQTKNIAHLVGALSRTCLHFRRHDEEKKYLNSPADEEKTFWSEARMSTRSFDPHLSRGIFALLYWPYTSFRAVFGPFLILMRPLSIYRAWKKKKAVELLRSKQRCRKKKPEKISSTSLYWLHLHNGDAIFWRLYEN